MSNFVFNVAKGRIAKLVDDGATFKMLVLKSAGTDATLKDLDNIAAVIAEGSTVEADFTNYARKTLASTTKTVDDTNNKVKVDSDDVVFASAGGASNNTTTDYIIYHDVDTTDANAVPLVMVDSPWTTDGNDVTIQFHADGWFNSEDPA